jgi:hypothetical protein
VVRARATGDYAGAPLWAAATASPAARGAARAWLAYCALGRPWVRRACALAAGAASFLIVWSEATIGSGTHPDLSPFSHVRAPLTLTLISTPRSNKVSRPHMKVLCVWRAHTAELARRLLFPPPTSLQSVVLRMLSAVTRGVLRINAAPAAPYSLRRRPGSW